MQRLRGSLCFSALILLLAPGLASAAAESEAASDLRVLRERLADLSESVQQRKQSLAVALDDESEQEGRAAASRLSAFFEKVDVSGLVAAGGSWQRATTEATPTTASSTRKDGTFQLYQGWLEIDKKPTEDSRAGFNISFVMGDLSSEAGSVNTPGIFSAYVSYLVPAGRGVQIDAGILPTALGAEYEKQSLNWNITRGLLFYLQPITSTGVTATYSLTDSLSLMVGALNDPIASARRDNFSQKALTSQLVFARETWSLKAGVNYGRTQGRTTYPFDPDLPPIRVPERYRTGIYDFVFTWNPFENLGFWANFDYIFGRESEGQHAGGTKAVALALRLKATETVGFAFRYEWVQQDTENQNEYQTLTATFSRKLTDSLTSKLEYRYAQQTNLDAPKLKVNGLFGQLMYEF